MIVKQMLKTVDVQVFGEAYRIVTGGFSGFGGTDAAANQQELAAGYEEEKNLLLNEPRGHRGMNGCAAFRSSAADYQLLFFQHKAAIHFKYESLLAVTAALLEIGYIAEKSSGCYTVETAEGLFTVQADIVNQKVTNISLEIKQAEVFHGASKKTEAVMESRQKFHLYSLPAEIPSLELEYLPAISEWGASHLTDEADGIVLVETIAADRIRTVTFEKDGYILRSPGIETAAAVFALRREETSGQSLTNESIFGSTLTIQTADDKEQTVSVQGTPYVTGSHEFILDPEDPLRKGFIIA